MITKFGYETFEKESNRVHKLFMDNDNIYSDRKYLDEYFKENFRKMCISEFVSIQGLIDEGKYLDSQFLVEVELRKNIVDFLNKGKIPPHEWFTKFKNKNIDKWE